MNYEKFVFFDWISYIKNNEDLLHSGIKTKKGAWAHWINNGKNEGRNFYSIHDTNKKNANNDKTFENFNWNAYLENYKDLQDSGINSKEKAWRHWSNHGVAEGRDFSYLKNNNPEYIEFDWDTYLYNYEDLKSDGLVTKDDVWKHWINHGKSEGRLYYKVGENGENEETNNFDWKTYVSTYGDLRLSGVSTKEAAWKHWKTCGINEERTPEYKNSTKIHCARFGNLFFLNMVGHFISLKNDLKVEYKYEKQFSELGIEFHNGEKSYNEDFVLTDENFMTFIRENNEKPIENNVVFTNEMWCHNKDLCFLLEEYFKDTENRNKIMNQNLFKKRYNKNNDLYIHVRLGDTVGKYNHLTYEYYDQILSTISFSKGYISSDTIKNDICKKLIKKYKLNIIYDSDIHTIMFGSTCKHVVLSGGTFSWLIGFLGFFSEIYCPDNRKGVWYGSIFVFPHWKKIESVDSMEIE